MQHAVIDHHMSRLAYRSGVTLGVTAPRSPGFLLGLGTAFSTGSPHRLAKGAVIQEVTALHIAIDSSTPSVSTHIAALRNLFNGEGEGELGAYFEDVVQGELPLVIEVQSADVMASLINLKKEVEERSGTTLRVTFTGANEAHLLAKEIGEAGIGVILAPRPFPGSWKSRRMYVLIALFISEGMLLIFMITFSLAGPPLTENNAASVLLSHNVTVALGIVEQWESRNLRFDVGWVRLSPKIFLSDFLC